MTERRDGYCFSRRREQRRFGRIVESHYVCGFPIKAFGNDRREETELLRSLSFVSIAITRSVFTGANRNRIFKFFGYNDSLSLRAFVR